MNPIIQLKNVNFWYDRGQPNEMQALHDINLEIQPGEYVSFFGPSGSGKTTLLYLLSGTEMSQDGEIIINGKDITKLSKKEMAIYRQIGVGMVFQQFNLIPNLNILDNVALPMAFLGVSEGKRIEEAGKLLERLNISSLAKRFPFELSGGQQQRVGIARALANNAPIIVADEPIGNLDSVNANNALDFLRDLCQKDGKTVIMVTHEAWSLRDATKIFYLKDGRVEKVETNQAKTPAQSLTEKLYKQLAPQQSKLQLAATALTNILFRGFSGEETERFNTFLIRRLTGQIDRDQFYEMLHQPFRQGGGGLWKQRALQVSRYVEGISYEHLVLEDLLIEMEKNPTAPLAREIANILEWLLEGNKIKLDLIQEDRLREATTEVLRSIITVEDFKKVLYQPKSKFGVGLTLRSTERIYEKFKMALGNFTSESLTQASAESNPA
jgi:putative ABC transport system ATP-binding protein